MAGNRSGSDLDNSRTDLVVEDDDNSESGPGCWENWKAFPKTVFAIFGNEMCERFSFYGMRAVLTLYLMSILGMGQVDAIAVFHAFAVVAYSTPLLGSILADGYIGKFHTILWISLVYAGGQVVLAVSAMQEKESRLHPWLDIAGLVIIAFGTGGIKPCVAAFGGDQFKRGQERLLEGFFSVFYFCINAGALVSSFITPIFRAKSCYGQDTCFPLAFGVPAVLMIVSVFFFLIGSFWYKRYPPKENVIFLVISTIHNALKNRRFFHVKREHWLDHYLDNHSCEYDVKCTKRKCQKAQFVEDIKAVLRVCVMYIPVPVFWALFDQQGSVWVIQGCGMDGKISDGFNLLPDQMTTLNAVLILIFIPIFQGIIYPLVRKCGITPTPLRRMSLGGLLAAAAYIVAMFVQFGVNKTLPSEIASNEMEMGFINSLNCAVEVTPKTQTDIAPFSIAANSNQFEKLEPKAASLVWNIKTTKSCDFSYDQDYTTYAYTGGNYYTVINNGIAPITTYSTSRKKPTNGQGEYTISLSFFATFPTKFNGTLLLCAEKDNEEDAAGNWKYPCWPKFTEFYHELEVDLTARNTKYEEVQPKTWRLFYENNTIQFKNKNKDPETWLWQPEYTGFEYNIDEQGGIYSMVITSDNPEAKKPQWTKNVYTIVGGNTLSILLQVPQYVVVTAGEILFSITGLEFSYSQAPQSMKSVIQAIWLLTVAIGDLLVLILDEAKIFTNLAWYMLLYAGLMVFVICIFMGLAIFWYKYTFYTKHEEDDDQLELDPVHIINEK